ncbi:MAG TPA: bifunctional diaminohydroxyphosphoribosylaminopyrimidine deaminase/5-amino-6-(5-phosphoribosylamino)uracil reductase RibD [Polyangia bacterium]|nr:bifunctional diaminohydroxyphosphoribosylaminopyrimidine deaminase/5-amino-6-(5-phosphoribosylamino)uracil reductase RibD [Polyangia bacterium]
MKRAAFSPADFSAADARFMRRALALAERGRGTTQPNPVVGAVIVRGGRVVAEGFHRKAGEAHAEVNALAQLRGGARGTTMYVTLEPCDHTGRTGPCTEVLIGARPARVVVGCRDPNPIVDGRGVARLRKAGLRVDVGCLEAECQAAIRAYSVSVRERRPLVTLKAAATLDGFIAQKAAAPRAKRAPVWITSPEARAAAHELRAAHDAILVGAGTVRADDPRLTVRLAKRRLPRPPLRVVLAGRQPLPAEAKVFDPAAPTLIIDDPRGRVAPRRALKLLAARGVQSVLVEGGAAIAGAFIASGLVDRIALFVAPKLIGGGVAIAAGADLAISRALRLGPISVQPVGPDLLLTADVDRG